MNLSKEDIFFETEASQDKQDAEIRYSIEDEWQELKKRRPSHVRKGHEFDTTLGKKANIQP